MDDDTNLSQSTNLARTPMNNMADTDGIFDDAADNIAAAADTDSMQFATAASLNSTNDAANATGTLSNQASTDNEFNLSFDLRRQNGDDDSASTLRTNPSITRETTNDDGGAEERGRRLGRHRDRRHSHLRQILQRISRSSPSPSTASRLQLGSSSLSIPALPGPAPASTHFNPRAAFISRSSFMPRDSLSSLDSTSSISESSAGGGADIGNINSLPYFTIADVERELPPEYRNCSICLEDFCVGETRKTLPCMHGFHKRCVDQWLGINACCPICKHQISSTLTAH